jgi:hypothetical protein
LAAFLAGDVFLTGVDFFVRLAEVRAMGHLGFATSLIGDSIRCGKVRRLTAELHALATKQRILGRVDGIPAMHF